MEVGPRRAIARILLGCHQLLEQASNFFFYVMLGLLPSEEVDRLSQRTWDQMESFGSRRHVPGALRWEDRFEWPLLKPNDRILIVGCGTGNDVVTLLRMGLHVEGIDSGPENIRVAREVLAREAFDAPLYVGSIERTKLLHHYDVFIFWCYCLMPTSSVRISTLTKISKRLRPGGRVLINYFMRRDDRIGRGVRLARRIARLSRSGWIPEDGDYLRFYSEFDLPVYEHKFLADEIESEAAAAGLAVLSHRPGELTLGRTSAKSLLTAGQKAFWTNRNHQPAIGHR